VIYILGKRQNKDTKQPDWYQNLIQIAIGKLAFLDIEKEQLILKRSFGYRLGKERHFKYCIKAYPIWELSMDITGRILCDFDILCDTMEQQIDKEKIKYDREQENLRKLREEKLRLEYEEQMRMDSYRRQQDRSLMGSSHEVEEEEPRVPIPEEEDSIKLVKHNDETILELGLNISLYHKCVTMIERGDGHLVAKKYYDLIMGLS
jgi:hypothetical protein